MEKIYVLDTSVLIHDPKAIFHFEDNDIVIPYVVLEELEGKKKTPDNVGMLSRHAIHLLDDLRNTGCLSQGVNLSSGGRLKIELNHISNEGLPAYSDLSLPDNRILAVAYNLTKENEKPVILVTKDIAMRVKADALQIKTQDYFNDKVDIDSVRGKPFLLDLSEAEVDSYYNLGKIVLRQPITPNACAIGVLPDGTQLPALASRDGSTLLKISQHKEVWNVTPKNIEQAWALALMGNPKIQLVNLMGPAGTGKTLIALASALDQTINAEKYTRILCARPVVPMGKDIGYLPGEKEDKVRPYMQPIYDNLEYLLQPKGEKKKEKNQDKNQEGMLDSAIDMLKKKRQLEIEVLTYIRGRSIPNQFIIIDEAQNLNAHEIKTIITRAGEGTKVVLCGDPDQIDNPYLDKESNGLAYVASRLNGQPYYGQVNLIKGERSYLATKTAELL